ncbi:plasma-membrane choline transporter family protein [Artemisia annua]|uniref:Choline transporter-like protein n=1 Tax=Artemisia annua TaxID=35608 RepID=A0A2U1PYZ6_ARTAN|nr:plasma-membrane choline transporter family protein [Artemisia annua]
MNHTQSQFSSSDEDTGTMTTAQQSAGRSHLSASSGNSLTMGPNLGASRHWRDVFWLGIFLLHLVLVGLALGVFGLNRYTKKDRLNIDQYTNGILDSQAGLTEDYWPIYAIAGAISTVIGWVWLLLLGSRSNQMMKISVHLLTTYLAVLSVLCFWGKLYFWGFAFAIGSGLQFLYIMSVIDRLPFTMLVLQGAVKMVWKLPEVMRVACAFMLVMLLWLALWSFGAAGVVASSIGDGGRWWLLVVFSVSLFWTGAVLCNTVHVIVSGMVFLVLVHGGREAASMPRNPVLKSLRYAVTTSFGSICYGSLFTAAIRTLRWEIRGFRSKIGNNECLLCCVDFLFHLVETLVRFFNKYAYVQIAVYGKSFNHSARDAWELFQSTGVEALIAYDCSGAVLLMGTLLGGLITGTCAVVLTRHKHWDREMMMGSTAILMGMVLVGLAMVVVESAVTSIYICYAEDPLLIHRWDPEFFNQMSETLHQRLQHRSARVREGLSQNRHTDQTQETI